MMLNILLNFSKAFDKVNYHKLCLKLAHSLWHPGKMPQVDPILLIWQNTTSHSQWNIFRIIPLIQHRIQQYYKTI